jgi:osmotically-inducible protein OsmY
MEEQIMLIIPSDNQIREDVLREFRQVTRLRDSRIEVEVKEHVVTLTGTVDSAVERVTAQEAAQRAQDAFAVVNNLEVKIPSEIRTDAEIAHEVDLALESDVMIPNERIRSTVYNGWIALEGTVDFLHEREGAERHVRRLAGVRGVYNQIEVSPQEAKQENVREAIAQELRRRAERDAAGIGVRLNGGVATLSGQVRSWDQECAIITAARQAPGIDIVRDQLQICQEA